MNTAIIIVVIVLLIACSAFVSLSEIALFSLPAGRIRSYRNHTDPKKRLVSTLLSKPKSLLVTLFLINTVLNILVQNVSSDLFSESGWMTKVGFPLMLVLIFGEILPKYLGLLYSDFFSYVAAPVCDLLQRITKPIREVLTRFTDFSSRLVFFFLKAEMPLSDNELHHALKGSMEKGLLHKEEVEFIKGYLELEGLEVKDLMIPKSEIPYYDIELPLSKLHFLFTKQPEVLVCKGHVDNVIGILDVKTYFMHKNEILSSQDLTDFVQIPYFVPETSSSKQLLQNSVVKNKKTVVAVDEYGVICGLVQRDDLVKEIIKQKTSDKKREDFSFVSKDAIVTTGKLSLQQVRDLFGASLISEYHSVTVGGYITEQLGAIPKSGETLTRDCLFFRILAASPTHVLKVYIQKIGKTDRTRKKE